MKKESELAVAELERRLSKDVESDIEAEDSINDGSPLESGIEVQLAPGCCNVVNLGLVPADKWSELKVSKISKFGDSRWDWRQEGSPVYRHTTFLNWDRNIGDAASLLDRHYAPLLTLLRALLFYCLPSNALFSNVKSYSSCHGIGKRLFVLARCLASAGAYVSKAGGTFTVANDLATATFLDFFEIRHHRSYPSTCLGNLLRAKRPQREEHAWKALRVRRRSGGSVADEHGP